jgi:hypothetical protein
VKSPISLPCERFRTGLRSGISVDKTMLISQVNRRIRFWSNQTPPDQADVKPWSGGCCSAKEKQILRFFSSQFSFSLPESNVTAMLVNVFYNLMAVSPCIAGRFG